MTGNITYSGSTPATASAAGITLGQLVQYVGQADEHVPFLTVRETFDFMHFNATVKPEKFGRPDLAEAHKTAVDDTLDLLRLRQCEHTVVGNELLRGVSGGEKKRVTVGEGLLTAARFLALDEISTGLDSAVTLEIIRRLKSRATATGLGVVVSLLQPTPEVYDLFDEVILLREGQVIYHGQREMLPSYLASLGFNPPCVSASISGGDVVGVSSPVPSDAASGSKAIANGSAGGEVTAKDMADWIEELLTNPAAVAARDALVTPAVGIQPTMDACAESRASGGSSASMASPHSFVVVVDGNSSAVTSTMESVATTAPQAKSSRGGAAGMLSDNITFGSDTSHQPQPPSRILPTTTDELAAAWRASSLFASQMQTSQPSATPQLKLSDDWMRAQYGRAHPHSIARHMTLLVWRQFMIMWRNSVYLQTRVILAVFLSFVLGGLYYQTNRDQGLTFYGTFLNTLLTLGFANIPEMVVSSDR